MNYEQLAQQIKIWGKELGFQKVGICDVDLSEHEAALQKWLDAGYHGSMDWMARHGMMRARPDELLPGTVRVISVRMDYLPPEARFASNLANTNHAYISRYALGRDYHKLVRKQLNKLGKLIEQEVGQCDKCKACITSCPTQAIVDEKIVDARRCISYLTIEFDGVIPEEFRKPMGNRIYGCDDCQLVCPWNRYAEITGQEDFHRRESFEEPDLVTMFNWDESTFLKQMEGSAIRRIGHLQWLRNISVALGNAEYSQLIIEALEARQGENKLLDEHIEWALEQQFNQIPANQSDSIDTKKKRLIRVVEKGLPRDA
ncbi:tRNA epoxyqueuosine(34) reductase QueG [Vibrio rotiferianus]